MNTSESSYEGALRRMSLLGYESAAESTLRKVKLLGSDATTQDDQLARMQDLEALATLSCEENERLEHELAELRDENATLRRRVEQLESLPHVEAASWTPDDEIPRNRYGYKIAGAIAVACVAALAFVLARPSAPVVIATPTVAPQAPIPPPVAPVAAVAPPVAAPAPPVVTAPEVRIPSVQPAPTARSRHSQHHASSKKHGASKHKHASSSTARRNLSSNDPLAGLAL